MIKAYPYIRSHADFKTKASGNLNVYSSLQLKGVDGSWYNSGYTTDTENSLYLEAAHALTLSSNVVCEDLHLNGTQDVARLSTGIYKVDVWGKLRTYTGSAPGTSATGSSGAGVDGWINGTIRFKGAADRTIVALDELSEHTRMAGWTMEFAFDATKIGTVNQTIRCGHLLVTSGVLQTAGTYEIRIAGTDYSAQPGNTVNDGTVTVKSGATLKTSNLHKNNVIDDGNCLASFTLESGATFIPNSTTSFISTVQYDLGGTVKLELGAQNFLDNGAKYGAAILTNYGTVHLAGSGAKSLVNNVTINTMLILDGTASLNLNSKTLKYGSTADLKYLASATTGSEIPTSGTGNNIPFDLIVGNGVTLTLNKNIKIRGQIVLEGTGSISYGGFTITPETLSAATGLTATAQTSPDQINLAWVDPNETYRREISVVVIGSSTAAGTGATTTANRWVNRFTVELQGVSLSVTVTNIAQGGLDTYNFMPTGYTPPGGRPSPDTSRNITHAISLSPDFIIVNNAGNDISSNYDLETEVKPNYLAIKAAADTAGIPIYFTTTQPRTGLSYERRQKLQELALWIVSTFEDRAINIFDGLAQFDPSNTANDLTIKPAYRIVGDDTHYNDDGHLYISDAVSAVFEAIVQASARVENYVIERSTSSGSGYSVLATIDPLLLTYSDTTALTSTTYYYRVKATGVDGFEDAGYSNVDSDSIGGIALLQTMKISFGDTSAVASPWNNVVANTSYNLNNTSAVDSNCDLAASSFSISGTNGASPDSGTGYSLPNGAMTTYFFVAGTARNLTFTGQVGKVYKIVLFGSRSSSGGATGPRVTDYTINGVTQTLDCFTNTSNVITFNNISLNGSNQIVITVARNAGNATNGYINAMIIEEYG